MPMTKPGPSRVLVVLVLAALITIAYGGSVRNEFVFDDAIFMQHDPRVRSLDQGLRLFVEPLWGFGDEDGRWRAHQYYRPLQTFPLALSRAAFGDAAWPSHVFNLLLHLLNSLMVLAIVVRVLRDNGSACVPRLSDSSLEPLNPRTLDSSIPRSLDPYWIAALAAALFAIHPGYSEAVLWISNIAGLGATACTLAIFLLHLSPRAPRWYTQLGTAVLFLLGLWFKESGILAPALIGLYDLLVAPDRGWRRLWRHRWRYAVFGPPFAVYSALRVYALGGALPGFETVPLTRWELILNAVALLPQYVATFVWPFRLNMYHDFNAIHDVWSRPFAGGLAILASGALLFALTLRSHPPVAFAVAWVFTAAAPHLLIRWPQLNVFAERYLYLPAVGVFLALAYVAERVGRRPSQRSSRMAAIVTVALSAVFLVTDIARTRDWRDEVSLYSKTLTQSARAELIRTNLAIKFLDLGRYDDGIALLKDLLAINPDWRDAWHNLGLLYLAKGEPDEALAAFERAREQDPLKASTWLNLGYLYDRAGRREEAVEAYFRAVRVKPGDAEAWHNLAVVAFQLGQYRNARIAAEKELAIAPDDAQAHALVRQLNGLPRGSGRPESGDASRRCQAAKQAVDEGRYADAIIALQAAAWFDEASPLPHHYLANVYYLTGRLPEAVVQQREALARAPRNELYRSNLAALERALAASAER